MASASNRTPTGRLTAEGGLKLSRLLYSHPRAPVAKAVRRALRPEPPSNNAPAPAEVRSSPRTRGKPSPASPSKAKAISKSSRSSPTQRRRRRVRKSVYTVFVAAAKETTRPKYTLSKELNYIRKKLPSKIREVKTSKSCPIERFHKLNKMEKDFIRRLGKVRHLKIDETDGDLVDKKNEVTKQLEDKLMKLQELQITMSGETQKERQDFQREHGRNACCKFCLQKQRQKN